jgi:hypothetical protein
MERKPDSAVIGRMTQRDLLKMWPVILATIMLGTAISVIV